MRTFEFVAKSYRSVGGLGIWTSIWHLKVRASCETDSLNLWSPTLRASNLCRIGGSCPRARVEKQYMGIYSNSTS